MTKTTALDVLLIQKDDTWDQCNWIVPLSKSLEGLTAEQAAWIPPSGGLSIWQLVNHMYYYNHRLLCRMQGKEPTLPAVDSNEYTFGNPGDATDANWLEYTDAGYNSISPAVARSIGCTTRVRS